MNYLIQAEQLAAVGPPLPSVLLLDIGLPGVTGFQILEYLRNRAAFSDMLKIVLSQIEDLHSIKHAYTPVNDPKRRSADSIASASLSESSISRISFTTPRLYNALLGHGHRGETTLYTLGSIQ